MQQYHSMTSCCNNASVWKLMSSLHVHLPNISTTVLSLPYAVGETMHTTFFSSIQICFHTVWSKCTVTEIMTLSVIMEFIVREESAESCCQSAVHISVQTPYFTADWYCQVVETTGSCTLLFLYTLVIVKLVPKLWLAEEKSLMLNFGFVNQEDWF